MILTLPSTTRNRQESPLLRLPPELRTHIYEIALGGRRIQVCDVKSCASTRHRCRTRAKKLTYDTYFHLRRRYLALLVTCRQVHEETKLFPFMLNEFVGYHWEIHLATYYRLTDAQVSAITNIRMYVNNDDVKYFLNGEKLANCGIQLSERFLSTLQVLAHLRGLNKITVEWTRQRWEDSWYEDWTILRERLLEETIKYMKQMGRGAEIEVAMLLSEPKLMNTESESLSTARTRSIAWNYSRPSGNLREE
jgi:hypothetical protein